MGGALSIQAEGGFLMVEYHKSSAALSLTAQLIVRVKLVRAITAVRSLGEDGGGTISGTPDEAPPHPHQRAQQKPKKSRQPKDQRLFKLAGGIGEIRTLDKALHPILP
jgi:hypothetical protein